MRSILDAWGAPGLPRGTVVTIGNFDGLHRGQRAIVDRVTRRAAERGLTSTMVTFDPHPLAVVRPEAAPQRLTTERQKRRLLEEAGIEVSLVVRFSEEIAAMSARRFVRELLVEQLAVAEVHVGSRFTFGRDREGDLELLRQEGARAGFRAEGVPEVLHGDEPISSTRIRRALRAGEVEEARRMLGRPWALAGTVGHGAGRGRSLGWPTINVRPEHELLPARGVYTTRVRFGEEGWRESVTNVGTRPTFDGGAVVVEAHVFDFDEETYGREVEVELHARLRGERRFPGAEELERQIARDVEAAREYFAAAPR